MAKIAIDIDDTITDSTSTIRKYMLLHSNEYEDGEILIRDLDIILRGFFNYDVVKKFFKDYALVFANEIKVRENAKEVIKKLKEEGNEIYIVTARNDIYYNDAKTFCENYLKNNGIIFDKVIINQTYKIKCCKENNIDIIIDDGVDTCNDLNKNNVEALLYTTELNKDKETSSKRVYSWNDVYNEIHKIMERSKANEK